jgi:hypothetical protein
MRTVKIENYHIDKILYRILKVIKENRDFLVENPPVLQWLMFQWDNIYDAGRACYGYGGLIESLGICMDAMYDLETRLSDLDDTVYDLVKYAMVHNVYARDQYVPRYEPYKKRGTLLPTDMEKYKEYYTEATKRPIFQIMMKENKEFSDWVAILGDNIYRYKDGLTTEAAVSNMLFTGHAGYTWNNDGYIVFRDEERQKKYYGWQLCGIHSFPVKYQPVLDQLLNAPIVLEAIRMTANYEDLKTFKQNSKDRATNAMVLSRSGWTTDEELDQMDANQIALEYEKFNNSTPNRYISKAKFNHYMYMSSTAPAMNMPENVHPSYITAIGNMVNDILDTAHLRTATEMERASVASAKEWVGVYRKMRLPHIINGLE